MIFNLSCIQITESLTKITYLTGLIVNYLLKNQLFAHGPLPKVH